ncbi:response regulator transcription factor [Nocardia cyriacigeorgica]|uniref:Response regulator transcription factor n=1 Tax=Nocardia cyriacigeorgica TaxID=135487 RepID=A0A6P1D7T4_9NOCA|nr:LytTR family DNA-binding domain-containing protein [Nocardia cyriacigeorgica]NEW42789.1 response regulator transcription factor [Nocardia cyriacigeorgica]NEW46745.1 response regulator transcription factor [Nocardia cyriacigeorgica]NEW52068.1 response regulator transcription factor [Nocardia cyriacigeorgica]NEW55862.1 response regulator transcription factor [Nocardia cyriacigeorgica]
MLRVLAVDDEKPALDELVYLLRAQAAVAQIHAAGDATSALRLLRAHPVDAVFLDINMPGLDGMELAGILSEFAAPPAVVFVTAHDDKAVAAFDLGAVDYLLKPLREARLAEAVRRIAAARTAATPAESEPDPADTNEVIPVELGGVTTLVHRSSVSWVEADGDYARLHTSAGSHLVRIPLSALEARWQDAGFLRVHRSYLVALRQVTGLRTVGSGTVVCLRGEGAAAAVELPVSRRQVRELKQRLVRGPRQTWTGR